MHILVQGCHSGHLSVYLQKACCREILISHERNRPCWWQRYKTVSYHQGNQQAADSNLRQANDLLPDFDADARRNQGDSDNIHSG